MSPSEDALVVLTQESTNFMRNLDRNSSSIKRNKSKSGNSGDGYSGRFVWRIENFTRLKDLLKKRKITALCIKSRHFQIGNRDCRLIVYPRGAACTLLLHWAAHQPLAAPAFQATSMYTHRSRGTCKHDCGRLKTGVCCIVLQW